MDWKTINNWKPRRLFKTTHSIKEEVEEASPEDSLIISVI